MGIQKKQKEDNPLYQFFKNNKGKLIHKWLHYFEIYDRYFSHYRNKDVIIIEFGVSHGGSLSMWKDYFGPKAKIYGVDINPQCQSLEEDQIKIFIADQNDSKSLELVLNQIPKVDILIDDGGHTMAQQINTFNVFFDHVKDDGIYLCEDLHTSYWTHFYGGYKKKNTFIEYSKNLIDDIHAWHSKQRKLKVNDKTRSIFGLHFYDSILVIEKRIIHKPENVSIGTPTICNYKEPFSLKRKFYQLWRLILS